jgi:hypothetical protein
MSKHTQHLEKIKDAIKTAPLSEDEKSQSMKRVEEWVLEDKAFGTLENELLEISEYFETLFAELGLSK